MNQSEHKFAHIQSEADCVTIRIPKRGSWEPCIEPGLCLLWSPMVFSTWSPDRSADSGQMEWSGVEPNFPSWCPAFFRLKLWGRIPLLGMFLDDCYPLYCKPPTFTPLGICHRLYSLVLEIIKWELLQRSKLRPFRSPWRVEKILASKISAKVANLTTSDLVVRS